MENENKIIELLTETVKGVDRLNGKVAGIEGEVTGMRQEMIKMIQEMIKQNLQLGENSRAILKLADEIRLVAEHEKRISLPMSMIF